MGDIAPHSLVVPNLLDWGRTQSLGVVSGLEPDAGLGLLQSAEAAGFAAPGGSGRPGPCGRAGHADHGDSGPEDRAGPNHRLQGGHEPQSGGADDLFQSCRLSRVEHMLRLHFGEPDIGLQIGGKPFAEQTILNVAYAYQQATDWHGRRSPI